MLLSVRLKLHRIILQNIKLLPEPSRHMLTRSRLTLAQRKAKEGAKKTLLDWLSCFKYATKAFTNKDKESVGGGDVVVSESTSSDVAAKKKSSKKQKPLDHI